MHKHFFCQLSIRKIWYLSLLPRPSDSTSDSVFCDYEDDDVDDGQPEDDDVGDVLRVPPEDGFVGKETFVNQPERKEGQARQLHNQGGPVRKAWRHKGSRFF